MPCFVGLRTRGPKPTSKTTKEVGPSTQLTKLAAKPTIAQHCEWH